MARREITLLVAGAGLAAALFLARRAFAQGALQTWDMDSGTLLPGDFASDAYSIDDARASNEPGLIGTIMNSLDPSPQDALKSANVQAFLSMIGQFEGGSQGYNALFGGGRFEDFSDHPRILVKKSGYASTAAGRYQIIAPTWDDIRGSIDAPDFSPYWQDVAAVYLIRRRGALGDVLAGNFDAAVEKVAKEWASLPGAGYGQPERSLNDARQYYADAGGNFA